MADRDIDKSAGGAPGNVADDTKVEEFHEDREAGAEAVEIAKIEKVYKCVPLFE